jgi:hypothetical protein
VTWEAVARTVIPILVGAIVAALGLGTGEQRASAGKASAIHSSASFSALLKALEHEVEAREACEGATP